MNLAIAILIVAGVTAVAIGAMLLVRRRAPEGSYFQDGDRASGVFGVLAAGFAIMLGFVIFLAFERYDAARSGAEQEALFVVQQFRRRNSCPPARVNGSLGSSSATGATSCTRSGRPCSPERRLAQPMGSRPVRDDPCDGSQEHPGGDGIRQVARPDIRPGGSSSGPDARSGGRHPVVAVDRDALRRRPDLRLHAVLCRLRRGRRHPGRADGFGRERHHRHAASAPLPRQPVPRSSWQPQTRGNGAHARHDRGGACRDRRASPAPCTDEGGNGDQIERLT